MLQSLQKSGPHICFRSRWLDAPIHSPSLRMRTTVLFFWGDRGRQAMDKNYDFIQIIGAMVYFENV